MLGQINKTLNKEITHLKHTLSQNQHHSLQEIFSLIDSMEISLQQSYKTIIQNTDKKAIHSKNQLKKQNRLFNHYHTATQKRQHDLVNQNQNLKEEINKNKRKIKQLLKTSEKYSLPSQIQPTKSIDTKGIQCELKDIKLQQILEDLKKQNISLNQKINDLQKTIQENEQNIDSANILIKELIKQLETNISDRETWNDAQSQRGSERSLLRFSPQSEQSAADFSFNSYQMSQSIVNCRNQASGEDNSTIDGSNTTHKDFALPEWLQFDEPTPTSENYKYDPIYDDEEKMWPELLLDRCRQLFGISYEI